MHLAAQMQCGAKLYQKLNLHTALDRQTTTRKKNIFPQKTPNGACRKSNLSFQTFKTVCPQSVLQSREGMHYSLTYQVHVHLGRFN